MSYVVRRLEVDGTAVIARAFAIKSHPELWRAQNEAERLARSHDSFTYDQDRMCWQSRDADGRTFRYTAGFK